MKIFRVSYTEDEVYYNTTTINVTDNEHLGAFKNLSRAENFIDKHYCKRYPGEKWNNNYGAAIPGEILKKKKKTNNGFRYAAGLVEYNISIEEIK